MGDVFIRPLSLPSKVHAVTVIDGDSNFNIYVNDSICREKQERACRHELAHIRKNHFYNCDPVVFNELDAQ